MSEIENLEAELARIRARRERGISRDKLRQILNVAFMLLAAVGLYLYFFVYPEGERMPALYTIGAALFLKIIEFVLRFTA